MGSNNDQCYIQNRVVTNCVLERSRCIMRPKKGKSDVWQPHFIYIFDAEVQERISISNLTCFSILITDLHII